MKWNWRFEWKPQDLWIGCYWKRTRPRWIDPETAGDGELWLATVAQRIDIWTCLIPCVPLHVYFQWGERLMTEQETIDEMLEVDDE